MDLPSAQPPTGEPQRDDVAALLAYADATYRAVTDQRRRLAVLALIVAAALALLAVAAGLRWADARARVDDVADVALVDVLGVQVPDPRPPLRRAELRVEAFVYGAVALSAAGAALLSIGVWALVRPPPVRVAPRGQPPM